MKITECAKSHKACVYCLVFPDGKRYVGKTHDLGDRVKIYLKYATDGVAAEIKRFGIENVDIEILFSIAGQRRDDVDAALSIIEIKYIRQLDTLKPNGYNTSLGGEVLGIPPEHITTDRCVIDAYYKANKQVLEYDLQGDFVKEYESIARCAYEKGLSEDDIRSALTRNTPFRGLCYLRLKKYGFIPPAIDVAKPVVRQKVQIEKKIVVQERVVTKYKLDNPVIVYDESGEFRGEFPTLSAAGREFGISGHLRIGAYYRGFIAYKKTSDDYPKRIEPKENYKGYVLEEEYKPKNELREIPVLPQDVVKMASGRHSKLKLDKPINQFKLNGEFVAQYKSIRDAAADTSIPYSQIYACVKGSTKKAAGYIWQKAEEG